MRVRLQLDRPEGRPSLRAPLTFSATLHGALLALALIPLPDRAAWGDAVGGGSAVPVNLAVGIPLPALEAPPNPLASDTRTVNPPEAKVPLKTVETPSSRELEIEQRRQKKRLAELEREGVKRELAKLRQLPPEAIPGEGGRASSTLFGRFPTGQGAGGIGFGGDFGVRYGWYVRAVRECISRHWDRGHLDPSIRSAPKVFLDFDIQRDGAISGEHISTSSGNPSVDREALRAVQACSGRRDVGADAHLPPLPGDYSGSRVKVEVWFEFRQ